MFLNPRPQLQQQWCDQSQTRVRSFGPNIQSVWETLASIESAFQIHKATDPVPHETTSHKRT
eukprot:4088187-Amphidinium_carterae.1